MQNHYGGHRERYDMHEVRGALKDRRIRNIDITGIAAREDAGRTLDGRCRTDQRTQGQGCLTTDPAEITETHYGNE